MKEKFVSYTDQREDLILSMIFEGVRKGFYIDVGANESILGNVTKHFYDRGWNGINIEPLPDCYDDLVKRRPKDINLNIGISNKQGIGKLTINGGLSSLNYQEKDKNFIEIKLETLTDIAEKHIGKKKIHFCKIDVEGFENEVLMGFNFEKFRPKVFCIESTYPGTKISNYSSWESILLKKEYKYIYTFGVNRYYVDINQKRLLENAEI